MKKIKINKRVAACHQIFKLLIEPRLLYEEDSSKESERFIGFYSFANFKIVFKIGFFLSNYISVF
jgi:hypothetical protein